MAPQLTDVATQLAGGQNPALVLLQQGGQLRDVFGSAGAAGEALLKVLTPTRLIIGGMVASAALFVSQIIAGHRESETLRRTLALTGNAAGTSLGQINGLTVADYGTLAFGMPVRITARVRMGSGRVIDISREVKMGGPIHSKGVLILSSYLATHYALDVPLSLWASLVFEQTYGGVEGDSASLAELCALLSALAGLPLSQSLAVTGSINQMGEVQPIGGVNEKIEGFFDLCKARGLTGKQGAIIPRQNVKTLMLRDDVVAAVAAGQFYIHAVSHVDEAMDILTGIPSGNRGSEGQFEDGTVKGNVEARLLDFASALRDFSKSDDTIDDGAFDEN